MKGSALVVALLATVVVFGLATPSAAIGLAKLRSRRAEPPAVAAAVPTAEAEAAAVMAEVKSEADEISEDGSNDSSAELEAEEDSRAESQAESNAEADESDAETETDAQSAAVPIHEHFRQFTTPMDLLPTDKTSLAEVDAAADSEADAESGAEADTAAGATAGAGAGADGEGKGSNPTYILPVDPFNYFPFFNGFSNVNPFSQFYPPPPYLYPQYTNYMHRYASHGIGHAPAYPYAGAHGGAFGHGAFGHGAFPYNYPHPNPHMHYPFGAYKLDVSGPDVRTGENNPPPFPQFTEVSSELITPEIIPKATAEADDNSPFVVAEMIEEDAADSDEDADDMDIDAEAEDEAEDEASEETADSLDAEDAALLEEAATDAVSGVAEIEDEIMSDEGNAFTSDVEIVDADESGEADAMTDAEISDDSAGADAEEGEMTEVQEFSENADGAEEAADVEIIG